MTNLLNTIKAYFAPTPEAEEETPVGIAAVTETCLLYTSPSPRDS